MLGTIYSPVQTRIRKTPIAISQATAAQNIASVSSPGKPHSSSVREFPPTINGDQRTFTLHSL